MHSTNKIKPVPASVAPDTSAQITGEMDQMAESASQAAAFLKAISHERRLMILCHLTNGEKSVTELETLLGSRQAAVSQQLSRLRLEGLVTPRRDGKAIYYTLADERTQLILKALYDVFCAPQK